MAKVIVTLEISYDPQLIDPHYDLNWSELARMGGPGIESVYEVSTKNA